MSEILKITTRLPQTGETSFSLIVEMSRGDKHAVFGIYRTADLATEYSNGYTRISGDWGVIEDWRRGALVLKGLIEMAPALSYECLDLQVCNP